LAPVVNLWVTVRPAAISVDADRFENPLEWTPLARRAHVCLVAVAEAEGGLIERLRGSGR
jgi:hypothetical protein